MEASDLLQKGIDMLWSRLDLAAIGLNNVANEIDHTEPGLFSSP